MGREITGVKQEKKNNGVVVGTNGISTTKIHVSSKISERISRIQSKEHKVKDSHEEKAADGEGLEKQDILAVQSTNLDDDLTKENNEKPGTQKSSENLNSSSPVSKSAAFENGHSNQTVPHSNAVVTERAGTCKETAKVEVATSENSSTAESPNITKASQTPNVESPTKSSEVRFWVYCVPFSILFFFSGEGNVCVCVFFCWQSETITMTKRIMLVLTQIFPQESYFFQFYSTVIMHLIEIL